MVITIYMGINEKRPAEDKQALARELTHACVRALGVNPAQVSVRFEIWSSENIAVGGELMAKPKGG